jgi:hypothetical protein
VSSSSAAARATVNSIFELSTRHECDLGDGAVKAFA